jgi:hypothetical protein
MRHIENEGMGKTDRSLYDVCHKRFAYDKFLELVLPFLLCDNSTSSVSKLKLQLPPHSASAKPGRGLRPPPPVASFVPLHDSNPRHLGLLP